MQVNPTSNIYLHNLTPHGFGREHPDSIQANLQHRTLYRDKVPAFTTVSGSMSSLTPIHPSPREVFW